MNKSLLLTAVLTAAAALPSWGAVPDGWSVTPGDGDVVTEIKTIVVQKNNGRFDPYVNCVVKINNIDYPITQKISGTTDDINTITLTGDAITADGTYNIVIPAGTFDYDYNWMMEEGDPNPEISFTVSIGGGGDDPDTGPDPDEFTPIDNAGFTITPVQGKVAEIKDFTLTYDHSGLLPEGNIYTKPVLVNETTSETVATFNVLEGAGLHDVLLSLDQAYTTPGTYIVKLPEGAISDYMDEEWPEAQFRYVIDGSLTPDRPQETVVAEPESGSSVGALSSLVVYFPNMQGIYANGPQKDNVKVSKDGQPTDITAAFEFNSSTMANGEIGINFTPAITEAGEYSIYVPANALSMEISTFDSRYNNEFTLNYTVVGLPADGSKFTVAPLTYKVVSAADRTVEVTWPANESEYSGVTEVPATVQYQGETYTVVAVGKLAFSEVTGISGITLPSTVTRIGDGAFWDSSLSAITIPETLTTIENSAFENTKLVTITIPETATSLGEDLFSGCLQLETINLPANMEILPKGLAQGCQKLATISFPESLKVIGEFAFSECPVLTGISLPSQLTTLERFAFAYTPELKSLPVPATLTTVGHGVFYQSGITEASLPDAITVIPDGMYQCCANLKEFTVANTVTEIETQAFYWCFDLEKITLGEKVATLGTEVFKGDTKLAEVISLNPVPPTGAAFENEVYTSATLRVPENAIEAYRAADGWKEFNNIVSLSSGITGVEAESFAVTAVGDGIEVTSDAPVAIYDAAGRCVYSGAAGHIALPRGLYLVTSGANRQKVAL